MVRPHQPGEAVFRSVLPEDIDWKPFPAFPPANKIAKTRFAKTRFAIPLLPQRSSSI
jgi:hypothetical protein